MAFDERAAIRYNRENARRVGWLGRFAEVAELLRQRTDWGRAYFARTTPGERDFAVAVGEWQYHHGTGLEVDGKLGPTTWGQMEPHTRLVSPYISEQPEWLTPSPQSPRPAVGGRREAGRASVADMDELEKIKEAIRRSAQYLRPEARRDLDQLLTEDNLKIAAGVLLAWAVSHLFGAGEIADALLLAVGVVGIGFAVFEAGEDLLDFVRIAREADADEDLDRAGEKFASALSILGIVVLLRLLTRGVARGGRAARVMRAQRTFRPANSAALAAEGEAAAASGAASSGAASASSGATNASRLQQALRSLRQRFFFEAEVEIVPHAQLQRPGRFVNGRCLPDGRIQLSDRLRGDQLVEVLHHELMHRALTPMFRPLRNLRSRVRMSGYRNSHLLRYLEEALAQANGLIQSQGFSLTNLRSALLFPIKNGYVTVSRVRAEAVGVLMGYIVIWGTVFWVSIENL